MIRWTTIDQWVKIMELIIVVFQRMEVDHLKFSSATLTETGEFTCSICRLFGVNVLHLIYLIIALEVFFVVRTVYINVTVEMVNSSTRIDGTLSLKKLVALWMSGPGFVSFLLHYNHESPIEEFKWKSFFQQLSVEINHIEQCQLQIETMHRKALFIQQSNKFNSSTIDGEWLRY